MPARGAIRLFTPLYVVLPGLQSRNLAKIRIPSGRMPDSMNAGFPVHFPEVDQMESGTLEYEEVAKNTERERIDMRVEPAIRSRADHQADRFGLSLSAYIRKALIRQIEEDEATEPEQIRKPRRGER